MPKLASQFAEPQLRSDDVLGLEEPLVTHACLPAQSVVIWYVSLSTPQSRLVELERTLSPDERARMSRYCFEHTRRAFTVSRASLRMILAGYCDVAAATLRFDHNAYGKPTLAAPLDHVHFNLSHSGDVAVVALSEDGAVGVDIERMRSVPDALDMARRFFSRGEFELLRETSDHDRDRAFLTLWTRKEACLKMLGRGLSLDSTLVDVTTPEKVTVVEQPDSVPGERLKRICVQDVRVSSAHIAAVAMNGAGWSVDLRAFDG